MNVGRGKVTYNKAVVVFLANVGNLKEGLGKVEIPSTGGFPTGVRDQLLSHQFVGVVAGVKGLSCMSVLLLDLSWHEMIGRCAIQSGIDFPMKKTWILTAFFGKIFFFSHRSFVQADKFGF